MDTSNDLKSAIKNIRYYVKHIQSLAKQQFDKDFNTGNELGVNETASDIRFNCLGAIISNIEWINTYCNNIEANIKHAEEQDKELRLELEEQADFIENTENRQDEKGEENATEKG